jgi:hypothetical protein
MDCTKYLESIGHMVTVGLGLELTAVASSYLVETVMTDAR